MVCHCLNSDGLPRYHLRRIGRRPSLPNITNCIDFTKRVTLIGRNNKVVDYVLSSASESQKRCISRTHARVIRSPWGNQHRLVDSSFTGVYVNDRRLDGEVVLSEGDTVTFGHPQSSQVDGGERVRQPNSEFYFMFELCDCEQEGDTVPSYDPMSCSTPTVLEFRQRLLSLDGWEVPAAHSGQGSPAGFEATMDCHSTAVAVSSEERSENRANVSNVAAAFSPVDGVCLRGEARASASPCPSSTGIARHEIQGHDPEPVLETDRAFPTDTRATRVTAPTLDRVATGNLVQHQGKGVQVQFTERDSTPKRATLSPVPPLGGACGDSALSCWPHSRREGDLVTAVVSGATHRDWEETAVTDSSAPLLKSEGRHDAVSKPSEGTLIEGSSAPEHSPSLKDPDDRLRAARQRRGVPGRNVLPEAGTAEGTARRRESGGLRGYPHRASVGPACEDDVLPQLMDVRLTCLEKQLTEVGTSADRIAGGRDSACEREEQLSSDKLHQPAIVLNRPEAILGTEASHSLPGDASGTPTEEVEKARSLINSELPKGLGILLESRGPHKLEAVSVGQSGWVRQRREGSSSVKEMGAATDTTRAECTTLDSSIPKSTFASETKLESKLPVELAENADSLPVTTLSTFGPSDPGENARPVSPSCKLHSSPVGPQGGVSTAVDPPEGDPGCGTRGGEARALGESETHRRPPRPSADVDVEDVQAQGELNLLDQRAQEMDTEESMETEGNSSCGVEAGTLQEEAEPRDPDVDASWGVETAMSQGMETRVPPEMEMGTSWEVEVEISHQTLISAPRGMDTGASQELEVGRSQQMETDASLEMEVGGLREDLKSDGNLEGTIHLGAALELEMASHGPVEGGGSAADVDLKQRGLDEEEDDSDAREASELLHLPLGVGVEEVGETMDKSMEVELSSECADRGMDVASASPAAVASKMALPHGGTIASATRLDHEVISKPISPEPSASAGELMVTQQRMFPPETHSKTNPCMPPTHTVPEGVITPPEGEDHPRFLVKTQEVLGTHCVEVGRSSETSPFSAPEAGEAVSKPGGVPAEERNQISVDPTSGARPGSGAVWAGHGEGLTDTGRTGLCGSPAEESGQVGLPEDEGQEVSSPLEMGHSRAGPRGDAEIRQGPCLSSAPAAGCCGAVGVGADGDPNTAVTSVCWPTPGQGGVGGPQALGRPGKVLGAEPLKWGGPIVCNPMLGNPTLSEWASKTPTSPDPTEEGSETPTSPDPTLSVEGFETQTLLDPAVSERGSETPTSPNPTLSEEGSKTPTSPNPTLSEEGSETPTSPNPTLSEEGSEIPTSPDPTEEGFETRTEPDPTLSEEGSETPTSVGPTTSEKESETPISLSPVVPETPMLPDPAAPEKEAELQDCSVSEQGSNPPLSQNLIDCGRGTGPRSPTVSSTTTVQGCTVIERAAGIPIPGEATVPVNNITGSKLEINSFTSQGLTITEGESDVTAPQGPTVTEGDSDVTAPQSPSVTERESDVTAPQGPSVTERESDVTAPQGPSVTERESDVTAPQSPSVTERESDVTAPQGPSVTERESDVTAPQSPSVTERDSDVTAPQSPSVTERDSDVTAPQGPSVTERDSDVTAPQSPSVTERDSDVTAPQGPSVTERESDVTAPQGPSVTERESDVTAPQGPSVTERESDVTAPQGPSVTERDSDVTAPQSPSVTERDSDVTAPQGPSVTERDSDVTAPQGPSVTERDSDVTAPQGPSVTERDSDVTAPQGPSVTERDSDVTAPQGPSVTERDSDVTAPQGPSVTERDSDVTAPQGPSVTERDSDVTAPQGPSVTERDSDVTAPQGPSVTERDSDVTAPQGPSVTERDSDVTAPQGPSVTEGDSDVTAPQGPSVTERDSDVTAPQGPSVTERDSDVTAPQGPSVTERDSDVTAPQGPSVTERDSDVTAPQGPTVTEGEIRVSASAAASMEEQCGRKAVILCGYQGGNDPQLNQTLPGGESDGFPAAVTTTADDPHWPSGIVPDEWLLALDAQLHLSAELAGGLVPEKRASASSKAGACLAAGLTGQPGRRVAGAGEGKQVGTNERQGPGASPFPSGVVGVVGSSPVDPGDLQGTEPREDAVWRSSSDAEREGGRPGELEPELSDAAMGPLECPGADLSEAAPAAGAGGEDAFSGAEQVDDERSREDLVFAGSQRGPVQSSVLSLSDPAAPGPVLETEPCQVCPSHPGTRGERRFPPSVTHFASAPGSNEGRSTCKASAAPGLKLLPGGSDSRGLVDERYGEANGPRALGPSPSRVLTLQQVPSSARRKEPPRTPPDSDGPVWACTEAMLASKSGDPPAELEKGGKGEGGSSGTGNTASRCSDLAHDTRDGGQCVQLQLTTEKADEDSLKKCRPPDGEGGSTDTCESRQAGEGTGLAGEGKGSLFSKVCLAKSLNSAESEAMDVTPQDRGRASRTDVELAPGDDDGDVRVNPECADPQHSGITLEEEEDSAGSWRSGGCRHLGSVVLKRPRESEVADSSSSFAPSKRKCTDQQVRSERRITLSLRSFSKELEQHQANLIGRMVRQFFAEYRPPWQHRLPKLAVVNRQAEVARIVKDFFESLSTQCKAEAVEGPRHSLTSSGGSQRPGHSGLESGEVSEDQERVCEVGPGPAHAHVTNDTTATVSQAAECGLPVCHASGGISWHDRDAGDSETCLLPEVTRESEAAQENSRDAAPDVLRHSPCLGQNTRGITQLAEHSPAEGFARGRKVYTEAPSPHEEGPIALPWFSSIAESPRAPGHDGCHQLQGLMLKGTSSDVSGTEEMAPAGRVSKAPLKPSSCALVGNVEEPWRNQSPFRPAERSADLAGGERCRSGVLACLPALCRDSPAPNPTDPSQVMEHGDAFQSCEGMNGLGVVQPSSPGCCRLAQCDGVDSSHAAQLGCSNNQTKPDSTAEPPAPDDSHLGRSDDEIESVNLAESPPLSDNFHDRTNNKSEHIAVEPALHLGNLQESGIGHSVAPPGSSALGFRDTETESANAKGQPAGSDPALGLTEDEPELGDRVPPSALDSSDVGCSDSMRHVTELSGLSYNGLALSNDKIAGPSADDNSDDEVEQVNIAETPALDNNNLSCCDNAVELVGITGSAGLDNNALGLSNDEIQSVITVEPQALDSNNPGHSDNLDEPVNVTEPPAMDNNDLCYSDDETELVISAEPQALDDDLCYSDDETELVISAEPQALDNDLCYSDDETELVISAEPQALDDDLCYSDDETELVISAEPQALDNDLCYSDDETELVISAEPQALDNDLCYSDDETELVISAEPQALFSSDRGHADGVIKPVDVAESSGLNDDALGLSNDKAELRSIAEPPALDDSSLGHGENEAEPVVITKPPASDSNALGHPDDLTDPVNVEWLFPHCNNLSHSDTKMESDDVTKRSSLDWGHNASSVDVAALGHGSPRSLAGVGPTAALRPSAERQGFAGGLGGCVVRSVAPGDRAVLGQSCRNSWELPGYHSSDQEGTVGCRSPGERESGVTQIPGQSAGLQLKNPLTTAAWSSSMENPALPRLRWRGGLHVGRTSSEETPGEPGDCRVPLEVDVKIERDGVSTEGLNSSPFFHIPPGVAPVTRNHQYVSPSLTETPAPPGTQGREQPAHPAVDTTRHDAGGAKEVVPYSWHPLSSGPDVPACPLPLAADRSVLALTSGRAGDPGARAGNASTSLSAGIQKPIKRESGSGREAGDHACGQWAVSSCLSTPPAGFAVPSGACPATAPPTPQGGLGWRPPDPWHSTSPPAKILRPQSPPTRPRCKSEPGLLSSSQSQHPLPPTECHEVRCLSCGSDGQRLFPLAEAVRSQQSTCNLSPGPVRSNTAGPPPGQTEFRLSQSQHNPTGHNVAAGASCRSEAIDGGLQRSEFAAHWGRKDEEASQPSDDDTGFVPPSPVHCWAKSDEDISFQLRECSLLLQDISEALEAEGVAEQHVSEWREQIKELQEQMVPPLTYVAVVGDTGSGKSSLLNALLDEEGVLPTSAMRACTAVVVEVSHNASSRCYTADIEFFSEEEWNKELLSLLSDMTDKKGRLKKRRPDPGSEAGVAYSRVKAVYGRVLPYPELAQIREVTQYLGTTKTISQVQVSDFRSKVQPYIDSRNDASNSSGGEFWPIVKRVRVRVPNSPVLQTGAVLVDLPGVRDSNAARNSVAKEYLKTCNAVWIVANVTRAVDDKTAKETLDESLRRQLLMDGQFGRIAFICTKTDCHNVTEIMRALPMTDTCSSLEAKVAALRNRIDRHQLNLRAWKLDLEHAQSSSENGKLAEQLELAIKHLEGDLTCLRQEEGMRQRELSLNAIRARNYFCKQKICLNFKRGLQDLKCQARDEDTDSDEESDEAEDEDEDDVSEACPFMADGAGPDPPTQAQLPVFTVSSTEYLKLRDKLQRDGPPRVFHNIEDTEIPAVQRFVHRITLARRALSTEVVIRKLATFVSHVVNYLTNRRAQSVSLQAKMHEAIRQSLLRVGEIFQQAAEDCSRKIEGSFAEIKTQLSFGKKMALKTCSDTVLRWGSRPPSGLPYPTYKATCSRNGTFSSPACGAIDFNEELSRPLITALQMVWNKQFNITIPQHLEKFKVDVLEKLKRFFSDLLQRVRQIEGDTQPVRHIRCQQLSAVCAKLENFAIFLMNDISARQRSISRILTPTVQNRMTPAYSTCAAESGPRCFDRMKSQMEKHVHEGKDQIFSGTCRKLSDQLDLLKQEIHSRLKQFLDEICNELMVQFEPLLRPLQIIDKIIPKLVKICKWMTAVCARSQVDFSLPKIEESNEEAEPATILRKPATSPLQQLEKFLGKVKMMKINQTDVNPTDLVEISANEVVLKYEEHEERIPFRLLSSCEFCVSIPFLILRHRLNSKGLERTDVVVLDEKRMSSPFAPLMEALTDRWQTVFRHLELLQGVQRLQSLRVICQGTDNKVPNGEEMSSNWPGLNEGASTSSSSMSVDSPPQSRKRPRCEMDHQELPPWGQASQPNNTETQTLPPVLKKEKRDCMDSGLPPNWENRSEPPVLEKQGYKYPRKGAFDNA